MNYEKKIIINATYLVKTRWNKWHEAQVCARRQIGNNNLKEYFVHYKELDRRYDEWVTSDKFDLSSYKDPYEDPDVILLKAELEKLEEEEQNCNILTRDQMKKRISHKMAQGEIALEEIKNPPTDSMTAILEKEFKEFTKIKYINHVQLGKYDMETWYFSPYPNAYGKSPKLFICPKCLKYMKYKHTLYQHHAKCRYKYPPGECIYRCEKIALFKIDGEKSKLYSQCLGLLGKLFIDQKTIYYDVNGFLFYVLCEVINGNHQIVGYFSKEKESDENNNIACIVVFPPFQCKGYGKLLIQISYELSKKDGIIGQPEKPLSHLGYKAYQWFWRWTILNQLQSYQPGTPIGLDDLSRQTGITKVDILGTLQQLDLLQYWKNDVSVCMSRAKLKSIVENGEIYKNPPMAVVPSCFLPNLRWKKESNLAFDQESTGDLKIKRPPNAFILFSNDHRKIISSEFPSENNNWIRYYIHDLLRWNLSKKLGQAWKELNPITKEMYREKAEKYEIAHKLMFPEYVYSPAEARIKKKIREKMRTLKRLNITHLDIINSKIIRSQNCSSIMRLNRSVLGERTNQLNDISDKTLHARGALFSGNNDEQDITEFCRHNQAYQYLYSKHLLGSRSSTVKRVHQDDVENGIIDIIGVDASENVRESLLKRSTLK